MHISAGWGQEYKKDAEIGQLGTGIHKRYTYQAAGDRNIQKRSTN
jgi:hypothetical protein